MPSPRSARFKGWNAADPYSGSVKTFNLNGEESSAQYQVIYLNLQVFFNIDIFVVSVANIQNVGCLISRSEVIIFPRGGAIL